MANELMTNEENYAFDVAGYLHIPSVLSQEEVAALNAALDAVEDSETLLGGATPHRELFRDLLGTSDIGVVFEPESSDTASDSIKYRDCWGSEKVKPAQHSSAAMNRETRPWHTASQKDRRSCQGVKAVWALDDIEEGDGGLVVVQASHKSNVETPNDLATGVDDMEVVVQPKFKAGDLFLVAEPTLQGVRPWKDTPKRLLSYWYAARAAIQSNPVGPYSETESLPGWADEATPAQKAVMYTPGYKGSSPPPVINTDGEETWVEEDPSVVHPSIYIRDPNSGIDEKEFYFWDLNGYVVVPGVMDEQWLAEANEAVDKFQDRIVVGEELARGSISQAGTGRPLLPGLLDLPDPYNAPFRRMIAHPAVVQRLNWMGGSGYRMGGATVFCAVEGTSGHSLHDGNEPMTPSRGYAFKNGRSYAETVTITWQLRDVEPGLGGFACVPGSHKTQYSMPRGIRTCDDTMGLVVPTGYEGRRCPFLYGWRLHAWCLSVEKSDPQTWGTD